MAFPQSSKILWALDPQSDKAQQLKTGSILKALTKNMDVAIEPVAVLSPDQLRIPPKVFTSQLEVHRNEAERRLATWLKGVKIPNLTTPTMLVSESFSRRSSVDALLKYAESGHISLIAMNTQARKGMMRFLLGSFAETLVLYSQVPLLVVNPKTRPVPSFKEILFTTDLSNASKGAFYRTLDLAANLKAKLKIYHKFEYVPPNTYALMHQDPSYGKYFSEDGATRKKQLDTWVETAKNKGVKAELIFDQKPGFITDAILKEAKKMKSGMIALHSSSTEVGAAVLGSVARQITRTATCPVWIVHHFEK